MTLPGSMWCLKAAVFGDVAGVLILGLAVCRGRQAEYSRRRSGAFGGWFGNLAIEPIPI